MSEAGARHGRDEVGPAGGGVFRRIAPSGGSPLSGVFGAVEMVFAPAAHQAREELERQERVGARNPSDTDPPDDERAAASRRVAAPGRPGTPFSGTVVLRPR